MYAIQKWIVTLEILGYISDFGHSWMPTPDFIGAPRSELKHSLATLLIITESRKNMIAINVTYHMKAATKSFHLSTNIIK